jgi:thiol:disulfide interchange protein
MVADWTGRQQVISDFLRAYGREGIPYYLIIPGRQGKSIELPTIIGPETIISSLNKALKG